MTTWLKLIGCSKRPITGHPFYGRYEEDHVGFRKDRKPGIRMDDHLFLYAPGGSRRIFALAKAISDPEHNDKYNPQEEGSCRWKINIRYLINLHVSDGIDIDEINTGQRDLMVSIQRQSHIRLFPDEYQVALSRLQQKSAE